MRTEDALVAMEELVLANITALEPLEPQVIPDYGNEDGDEEVMVLLLSDLQVGHQTPTTTARIIENRMERMTDRVIRLAGIHRNAYPIKRLCVFMLGDLIQSEQTGRKVSLDELEMTVMPQMFEVAIPAITKMLLTFEEHFEQVDCYGVPGNHGNLGRYHAETTNWDTIIYKALRERLREHERVTFTIEDELFWQKVKIWKWVFLLVHGESIRMWMNYP